LEGGSILREKGGRVRFVNFWSGDSRRTSKKWGIGHTRKSPDGKNPGKKAKKNSCREIGGGKTPREGKNPQKKEVEYIQKAQEVQERRVLEWTQTQSTYVKKGE